MSVNGRPFKPDPTAFSQTGIPCGDPDRYKSRGIIRTAREPIPFEDQRLGVPGLGTVSQAEIELKNLLKRQLETNMDANITESANRKITFTAPALVQGTTFGNSIAGAKTLSEFKTIESIQLRVEELRAADYSDDQIRMQLEKEGYGTEGLGKGKKRKLVNPEHLKQERELIEREIKKKKVEEPKKPLLSRHAAEVESSLLQGKKNIPLAHLFIDSHKVVQENEEKAKEREKEREKKEGNSQKEKKKQEQLVLDSDTEILPIPIDVIQNNRLSLSDLLTYDNGRFANYAVGEPSKILYIKNLDTKVVERDLVALFIRFQVKPVRSASDLIEFRLLSGRMKGQAFVTFPNVNSATAALALLNGYMLHGKPMVIQYGRK